MVVNEQEINEVVGKDVFTDKGSYCGKISDIELDIAKFRIKTIVIDAAKGSYLSTIVGGKKGVKIPYTMINAIDDIVIVRHIRAPAEDEE
jgi:sporulation protein YlmC with PRC-barrel domain